MAGGVVLFVLVGGWGESGLEQALGGAHRAAARDLLEVLLELDGIDRAIIATDDPSWRETLASSPVEVDLDSMGAPFHFGRRLAALIERYDAQRLLYTGGGSAPLLAAERWTQVVERLNEAGRLVVTNNVHSSDWVGIVSADDALPLISRQASDNGVAWVLANEAAFPVESMEATAGTRFDLDTPVDLLIAQRHPGIGVHLRRYLNGLGWESRRLDGVLAEMAREGGSLAVIGRASSAAWTALEQATRCWVRVFVEERGMRASGRQQRGEVRSLVADYLSLVEVEGFFDELASLANGVLFDNRVILAAQGLWPSAVDRFNADLYRWAKVQNPFLRRLTRAAAESSVPVVLGGHSVVAGGLMALVEAFRMENEGA